MTNEYGVNFCQLASGHW